MQQIRDKQSKMMDTTRHEHEKELEQLHQDMNDDFDWQCKQQGDKFAEQAKKFSKQLQAQKERDINWLEEEYEAKTAEFKKTLQDSTGIQLINKQAQRKQNYRNGTPN